MGLRNECRLWLMSFWSLGWLCGTEVPFGVATAPRACDTILRVWNVGPAALPIGLTHVEEDDDICTSVIPAHGGIACLRAAWLYNEVLGKDFKGKRRRGGRGEVCCPCAQPKMSRGHLFLFGIPQAAPTCRRCPAGRCRECCVGL